MTHYLFVPGGKRTENDFNALRALLDARSHRTDAITLSDPEKTDLSVHVSELCDLILQLDANDLHLVGHSYASFVITGAADRMPARIGRMVYLDSLIPQNGKSLFDFFEAAGVDPAAHGVPAWPPFVEKLCFDTGRIDALRKSYIHCLNSQFLVLTRDVAADVRSRPQREHWQYFELDADHYCMIGAPEAVVKILVR